MALAKYNSIAAALSTARKYARKAEGGADLEDPKAKAIGIRPVEGTPDAPEQPVQSPPQGSWGPPVAPENDEAAQAQEAREAAAARLAKGVNQLSDRQPGKLTEGVERFGEGAVDMVATPGKLMSGPEQVKHKTPGFETEEEFFLQNLNNQNYDREMTDFGAGTATGMIGLSKFFKTPENSVGIGGAKLKTPEKFWHPYDLEPTELKGAQLLKSNHETGGSNPGGVYQLNDGSVVYVKQFEGESAIERTYNEKLANELLKLTGTPVADVRMTKFNGKPAIVSGMVPGEELNKIHSGKYDQLEGLRSHYPAHLWTGNYDFVGVGKNNMMVTPEGKTVHIDPGGALRYRAQGKLKGPDMWGPNIKHFDLKKNHDLADVMEGHLDSPAMHESAKRVAAITDQQIYDLVEKYGPLQKGEKAKLLETLKARRDGVAKLYGVDKAAPPAPPTGGSTSDLTTKTNQVAKKIADNYYNELNGEPYAIANKLYEIQKNSGKELSDAIGAKLPMDVRMQVGDHLNDLEAMDQAATFKRADEHNNSLHEPDHYAMGDDMEPPPPEHLTSEDLYYQNIAQEIKHKPEAQWWRDAPVIEAKNGGYPTRQDYKIAYDDAAAGKPSPFRKIADWKAWQPPYTHDLVKPKLSIPNWLAKKLGFNPDFQVVRGGSHDQVNYPHVLDDPHHKRNSNYPDEHALFFFPDDKLHMPHSYGTPAKPYVIRAQNAFEAYYPRLRGIKDHPEEGAPYSSQAIKRIIDAGHDAGADVLILHGLADAGGINQTQILILNQKGTLRAVNAKFNPKDLVNENAAKPMYGIIGGVPFAYDALKRIGGGNDKDEKMARGGRVKFKPFSSIEIKPRRTPKTVIHAGAAKKALRTVKHFARGGATEPEPKEHEFINFAKGGMIQSNIPGRTDKIPMKVSTGAYVLPADIPSALGEGNTMAGKTILDKMFKSGPYGLPLNKTKPAKFQMPHLKGFAEGGEADETPIIAAGGEYIIHPDEVLRQGNGDMKAGHRVLDAFVLQTRAEHIKTLQNLAPPK